MSAFSSHDFALWFESIHGFAPYPWQARLVDEILAGQRDPTNSNAGWPDVLDLPTGAGKTSAIDIAIYTQAADPKHAPRRLVYVVDRRAIVSQTTEHVCKIQSALISPKDEVQQRIANALRSRMAHQSPDRVPLLLAELRGGIPLDNNWASEPDIPAVLISTVDQVGSRLLFSGYGVSPKMRPIHAGLLGNDCLWLLDEVHLSKPFAMTLNQLQGLQEACISGGLPVRNALVQMSATPVDKSAKHTFKLDPITDIEASERLRTRVQAVKYATLRDLKLQGAKRPEDVLIERIPKQAKALKGHVIGVIVNRVETAVKVARRIREEEPNAQVITLTGRMRPLEREQVWARVEAVARAGRDRNEAPDRVYVVSTQTIEAGADLDFDAMLTEVASMDALVQRAGRVDRRGELSAQDHREKIGGESDGNESSPQAIDKPLRILVVAATAQTKDAYVDPVYGDTLVKTWNLLKTKHGDDLFDMGPASMDLGSESERLACSTPQVKTTRLMRHHLDALCQTNPEAVTRPEVAYHLHGVQESRAEVSVVWRGEMPSLTTRASNSEIPIHASDEQALVDQLLICPPRSSEAISLPLPTFKSWVAHKSLKQRGQSNKDVTVHPAVADVDRFVPSDKEGIADPKQVYVLRWAGAESELVPVSAIRNGDTVIVPRAWGGISDGNWDADATDCVRDLGDWAQFKRAQDFEGERPTIRLSNWFGWPDVGLTPAGSETDGGVTTRKELRERLALLREKLSVICDREGLTADQRALLNVFDAKRLVPCERIAPDDPPGHDSDELIAAPLPYYTLIGAPLVQSGQPQPLVFETDGSDEANSLIGQALTLDMHSDDVGTAARAYAYSLGIESFAEPLRLAGSFHDLGKADPRFQRILHGGDPVAAAAATALLAKSTQTPANGAQALAIIEQSRYPKGTRHELLSLALLESLPPNAMPEAELVKHLVTTHHGVCRALPPRQDDSQNIRVEVEREGHRMNADTAHGLDQIGSGIVDRFWAMTERFGWYGLAWLEAVLRLADHHESARRALQANSGKGA